ncbi:gamma-glutamyltransferase family protein [Oceanidesulfovibrio marinus]|uniref:gamma-glutamyltransferase family protein n=1 Tax=Oceanidesulfovibrio marinus TaxID=370038 RepID=UPI001F2C6FB2|nr:gamma-glutamyltransferase family protein [Oceanidesulfovibrio marinus]
MSDPLNIPARDPDLIFRSRRSPVCGTRHAAASSQPLATWIGMRILENGGSAADAAVAMAAVLAVVEPCSTGLGGDAFALYYDAEHGAVHALNGSGRSPSALTPAVMASHNIAGAIPPLSPLAVTVPGACGAWADLSRRFGRLGLGPCLEPAVELAESGFAIGPVTASLWRDGMEHQLIPAGDPGDLMPAGRAPAAGERITNKALAGVLKRIAADGPAAFYQGEIAATIARAVQDKGGVLAPDDLARHLEANEAEGVWSESMSTTLGKKVRIHECPPNSQGIVALIALAILEAVDANLSSPSPSAYDCHLMVEALRLAFAEAHRHVSDPRSMDTPAEALLDPERITELACLVDPEKCLNLPEGSPPGTSDTVYFCVVDGQGNACSMVNSNYLGFGSGIVPPGLGFSLQNRGANFSLQAGHPNEVGPNKRPYHTIIPSMATRAEDGALLGPFGVMGGFMQPQGHVQVAVNLFCRGGDGLDPQTALDLPRFCIPDGDPTSGVALEDGMDIKITLGLAGTGHMLGTVTGMGRSLFGRGQIILRNPESGCLAAGSDPRADGLALAR